MTGSPAPPRETVEVPFAPDGGKHMDVLRNFVNAILRDELLVAPGGEGLHSLELGNAMVLSGSLGEPVSLPLDGDAYERLLRQKVAEESGRCDRLCSNGRTR